MAASAALGVDMAGIADAAPRLWRGNLRAASLFFSLAGSNCWRQGPMGHLLGLDWQQALAKLQMRGDKKCHWRRLLDGLATMEREAVAASKEGR